MRDTLSLGALQARLSTEFIGRYAVHLASVSSTMDAARDEAESGAPEGLIVVADEQTRGRGRRGRQWVSPPGGNIYVTIVLRPASEEARSLSMIAPLAVTEAAAAVGVRCSVKWPNDVMVGGRKLAGVLIETRLGDEGPEYALVGIGMNVNFDPRAVPEIADTAISLSAELGLEVDREEVLAALLNAFERLYLVVRYGGSVRTAWRERLETLGRRVEVRLEPRVEVGVVEDIDEEGNLVLRRDDGSQVVLVAGDVTLSV